MINKNQLSIEGHEICSKLKSMRCSGMAGALEEVLADPNAELLSFREKNTTYRGYRMESTVLQEAEPFYQKGDPEISRR